MDLLPLANTWIMYVAICICAIAILTAVLPIKKMMSCANPQGHPVPIAVRLRNAQYDSLVSKIPLGLYIARTVGESYTIEYASPVFADILGLAGCDNITASQLYCTIHPDDQLRFSEQSRQALFAVTEFEWSGQVIANHQVKWVKFHATPERNSDGSILWHGILLDETDQNNAALSLQINVQRLRDVQSYASIGWWEIDKEEQHSEWAPEIYQITGISRSAVKSPVALTSIIHRDDIHRVVQSLDECFATGKEHQTEYRIIRPDSGEERWLDCRAKAVLDSSGTVIKIAGFMQDITERKRLEEQIMHLANRDSVTGLPNRRILEDRLDHAMAQSRRHMHYGALMFIDIDKFKIVNDTYGHRAGDKLLLEVADRIRRCVRETDTVSRYGGDEFVTVLGELNSNRAVAVDQVTVLAEDIREMLAKPYRIDDDLSVDCSASIGVTLFMNGLSTAEQVTNQADAAMYQSKDAGGNPVRFFVPESREHRRNAGTITPNHFA